MHTCADPATLRAGGTVSTTFPPNVVQAADSPYSGQSPPPNQGNAFSPLLSAGLAQPPQTGLIVKKAPDGRWLDGNARDWTPWVSGANAAERVVVREPGSSFPVFRKR